jgi:hypothetical protein
MSSLLGYTGDASVSIPFAGVNGSASHKSGGTKSTIRMEGVENPFGSAKTKKK